MICPTCGGPTSAHCFVWAPAKGILTRRRDGCDLSMCVRCREYGNEDRWVAMAVSSSRDRDR